jgi:hypothetical protein
MRLHYLRIVLLTSALAVAPPFIAAQHTAKIFYFLELRAIKIEI